MSTKYNEEAEDLMFELFDEDDFTKVISFVDKYGCDFVDRDGRNLLMNFIVEGKSTFAIELIKQYKMNGLVSEKLEENGNEDLAESSESKNGQPDGKQDQENGADITVNNNSGVSPMSFVTKKVKKWINENLITNSKPTE